MHQDIRAVFKTRCGCRKEEVINIGDTSRLRQGYEYWLPMSPPVVQLKEVHPESTPHLHRRKFLLEGVQRRAHYPAQVGLTGLGLQA